MRHSQSDTSSSSSEEEVEYQSGYSSTLLQQFVEKTEIISAQWGERLLGSNRARKMAGQGALGGKKVIERRGKRGRPPKIVKNMIAIGAGGGSESNRVVMGSDRSANKMMPELEAYRLDCSHSNVSPDSGIQSVPGSPVNETIHRSPNRDTTPPILRPVSPVKGVASKLYGAKKPEDRAKKKPGRPKKYKSDRLRSAMNTRRQTDVTEGKSEDRPPIHSLIPGRRGPGRPKKAPPVLEPNIPIGRRSEVFDRETENFNIMLNEICERVSKRLEIPVLANGPGRSIEINEEEIERLITDHKSGKSGRNSKIDVIFSKPKRLSNVPNIAIVKPMQHHIVNDKQEDDDAQGKRPGRRRKLSQDETRWKDLDLLKRRDVSDVSENDSVIKKSDYSDEKFAKGSRDRRRFDERKHNIPNAKHASPSFLCRRSRQSSLAAEEHNSERKKADSRKVAVSEKKTKKSGKSNSKTAKALQYTNNVFEMKVANVRNLIKPVQKQLVHGKHSKLLGVGHGLLHHRHKKRKKSKKHKSSKRVFDSEAFLKELEKLIAEFQKFSIDSRKKEAAVQGFIQNQGEMAVPSEFRYYIYKFSLTELQTLFLSIRIYRTLFSFRVKRIGKKRKGSERSRGSDRESGAEKSKQSDRESGTEQAELEQPKEKEKPKRKQKKSQHEIIKVRR